MVGEQYIGQGNDRMLTSDWLMNMGKRLYAGTLQKETAQALINFHYVWYKDGRKFGTITALLSEKAQAILNKKPSVVKDKKFAEAIAYAKTHGKAVQINAPKTETTIHHKPIIFDESTMNVFANMLGNTTEKQIEKIKQQAPITIEQVPKTVNDESIFDELANFLQDTATTEKQDITDKAITQQAINLQTYKGEANRLLQALRTENPKKRIVNRKYISMKDKDGNIIGKSWYNLAYLSQDKDDYELVRKEYERNPLLTYMAKQQDIRVNGIKYYRIFEYNNDELNK